MSSYFVIGCYLTAFSILLTGLFVYLKNRQKPLNRIHLLFSIASSIWSFFLGAAVIAPDPESSLILFRIEHVGVVFIPTMYLHLALVLVGLEHKYKKLIYSMYVYSAVLFFLNFTDLIVKSSTPKLYFPYYKNPGSAYPFVLLLFVFGVSYAFHQLFAAYRKQIGYQRNRLKLFLIATVIGFSGGLPTFLPAYNVYNSYLTIYLTTIYAFILAYAIVRYRLMDITVAINRGTAFVLTILLGLLPTAIIIYFLQKVFPLTIPIAFTIVLAVSLAFLFNKIHPFSERFIQKRFFKTQTNYYQVLRKFTNDMVTAVDLGDLLKRFDQTLREAMQVTSVAVYLTAPPNGKYPLSHASDDTGNLITVFKGKNEQDEMANALLAGISMASSHHTGIIQRWKSGDALVSLAYEAKDVLVLGEMEMMAGRDDKKMHEAIVQMKEAKAEVCMPLKRDGKMIGMALLGPRNRGQYYSPQDLDLLHMLGQNACVAIQNAILVEEIKRSYEIVHRMHRLAAMGTLIAGVSHEIRNPLMPLGFLIDMVGDTAKNDETLKQIHKHSSESIRRIISVLDEMDEFARPQKPVFGKADVNAVLDDALALLDAQIKLQKQEVIKEYAALPAIMVDEKRLRQAAWDIILNAIEANQPGGRITLYTREIQLKGINGRPLMPGVQIEIRDTGCGIPPENIERVFDPFFTTKHESLLREGTGLGMAIAHKIIEEHSGSVEIRSELGRGTSVFVNLMMERS